jgi:hypothetical protein
MYFMLREYFIKKIYIFKINYHVYHKFIFNQLLYLNILIKIDINTSRFLYKYFYVKLYLSFIIQFICKHALNY